MQPARVAQLPVRLQGHRQQLRGRGDAPDAGRAATGARTAASISTTSASRRRCSRFRACIGADPMLGVEMASTGEVGCFGDDVHEALLHALIATGFRFPTKGVLLSLGPIARQVLVRRRGAGDRRGAEAPDLRHARHRGSAALSGYAVHVGGQTSRRAAPARCKPSTRARSISSSTSPSSTTSSVAPMAT